MKSKHIGSSFDEFLKEEGIYGKATGYAKRRVIAMKLAAAKKTKKISKTDPGRRPKTSRTRTEPKSR